MLAAFLEGLPLDCSTLLAWPGLKKNDILAIYGPMIYTAPYVMFLMRADPLRGQAGGGWAQEIETFFGPEMATSEASAIWSQKSDYTGQT